MVSSCVQEVRECRIGSKVQSIVTLKDLFDDIPLRLRHKQNSLAVNNDKRRVLFPISLLAIHSA